MLLYGALELLRNVSVAVVGSQQRPSRPGRPSLTRTSVMYVLVPSKM